jgi:hypothetical protein
MKMRQVVGVLALVGVGFFLILFCQTIPEKAKAVQNFEKKIFRKMV